MGTFVTWGIPGHTTQLMAASRTQASMLSSYPSIEELSEDWDCLDCSGPPPSFFLPPPPCPTGVDAGLYDAPWTCPVVAGGREASPGNQQVSIAVVVITAATCVLLAAVAAVIVCR